MFIYIACVDDSTCQSLNQTFLASGQDVCKIDSIKTFCNKSCSLCTSVTSPAPTTSSTPLQSTIGKCFCYYLKILNRFTKGQGIRWIGEIRYTFLKGFRLNFHRSFVVKFPDAHCRCFVVWTFLAGLWPFVTFISWNPRFVFILLVLEHHPTSYISIFVHVQFNRP